MKHARVVYQGVVHGATEKDGWRLLLDDGQVVSPDAVSWLPPDTPSDTHPVGSRSHRAGMRLILPGAARTVADRVATVPLLPKMPPKNAGSVAVTTNIMYFIVLSSRS